MKEGVLHSGGDSNTKETTPRRSAAGQGFNMTKKTPRECTKTAEGFRNPDSSERVKMKNPGQIIPPGRIAQN